MFVSFRHFFVSLLAVFGNTYARKDTLFTTADLCPAVTVIPNSDLHVVQWSSSLYGRNQQNDDSDLIRISCPKNQIRMFFKLTNIISKKTQIGSEQQVFQSAMALTFLYHFSEEHSQYLAYALSAQQPLYIFFLDKNAFSKMVPRGLAAYLPHLNRLVILEVSNTLSKVELDDYYGHIEHELRHRFWHVLQSQLTGRVTALVSSWYPPDVGTYFGLAKQRIESGDRRLFVEIPDLLRRECENKLTKNEISKLEYLRKISLTFAGLKQISDVRNVTFSGNSFADFQRNRSFEYRLPENAKLKLVENKYFETVDENKNKNKIKIILIDPLVALILHQEEVFNMVNANYNSESVAYEREAYLWTTLHIGAIREFYPEALAESQRLIALAKKHPKKVNYSKNVTTHPAEDNTDYIRFFSQSPQEINQSNADTVLMTMDGCAARPAHYRAKCKSILQAMLSAKLRIQEVLIQLALFAHINKEDATVCEILQKIMAIENHGTVNAKLNDYELTGFLQNCLNLDSSDADAIAIKGLKKLEKTAILPEFQQSAVEKLAIANGLKIVV